MRKWFEDEIHDQSQISENNFLYVGFIAVHVWFAFEIAICKCFLFGVQKRTKKAALKDFWSNLGVSVKDLRAAGVKNIVTDSDDPDVPKGYSFGVEKDGLQYYMTGTDDTVVSIDVGDDDQDSTIINVTASSKFRKKDVLNLGGANKRELMQYREYSYEFMMHTQKKHISIGRKTECFGILK